MLVSRQAAVEVAMCVKQGNVYIVDDVVNDIINNIKKSIPVGMTR